MIDSRAGESKIGLIDIFGMDEEAIERTEKKAEDIAVKNRKETETYFRIKREFYALLSDIGITPDIVELERFVADYLFYGGVKDLNGTRKFADFNKSAEVL